MAKDVSVEIGFAGGGSTAVSMPDDSLEAFTAAVTAAERGGWYTVVSSDGGEFLVDVTSVVFVRVGTRNRSIGFSNA